MSEAGNTMPAGQIEQFTALRTLLFGIAYRMLGTVQDAEDVLQDAYIRWQATDHREIDSPRAYLTTMVTRLCIDFLRSAQVRRETYVGPWLPEPLPTDSGSAADALAAARLEEASGDPADPVLLGESLSTAFLLLLERLNPVERATFLLHDVFDYDYAEIAPMLGKSEANLRQIARRAREHITTNRPRFETSREKQEELVHRFLQAAGEGDVPGLVAILADDVVVWADGGGKATAARNPVSGADKAARFMVGLAKQAKNASARLGWINNQPGLLVTAFGRTVAAFTLHIADGRIQSIYIVVNPDKLQHVSLL